MKKLTKAMPKCAKRVPIAERTDLLPIKVEFAHLRGDYGEAIHCDKLVRADPRQHPSELISTLVHETLHIAGPYLDESAVDDLADNVAAVLWNVGYRRVDKE